MGAFPFTSELVKFNIGTFYIMALEEMGFLGPIYSVNPKYEEVLGRKCYPSLLAIPGPVDYVQVNLPAEMVPQLLEECAQKGVKAVQFFTAGFSESGFPERVALERQILMQARQHGIRLIGPNCMGFINTRAKVSYLTGAPSEPGPVGLLSQSAGVSEHIVLFGSLQGLHFSMVFNQGNAIDINEAEVMEYLAQDPETELIGAYIEGVREGRRFFRALKEAAARKPVVIWKGGRAEAGARATLSHTASMAGSQQIFKSLCRQAGALLAESVEELLDMLVALRFVDRALGPRACIMGPGGGASVLCTDALERAGLAVPPIPLQIQRELRRLITYPGTSVLNPLDVSPFVFDPNTLREAIAIVDRTTEVDFILIHGNMGFAAPQPVEATLEALVEAKKLTDKPILLVPHLQELPHLDQFPLTLEKFYRAGFPLFFSAEQAAKAIAKLLVWQKFSSSTA